MIRTLILAVILVAASPLSASTDGFPDTYHLAFSDGFTVVFSNPIIQSYPEINYVSASYLTAVSSQGPLDYPILSISRQDGSEGKTFEFTRHSTSSLMTGTWADGASGFDYFGDGDFSGLVLTSAGSGLPQPSPSAFVPDSAKPTTLFGAWLAFAGSYWLHGLLLVSFLSLVGWIVALARRRRAS